MFPSSELEDSESNLTEATAFPLSHSVVSDTAESLRPYEAEQIATGAATCFFTVIICRRSGTSLTSLTAETSPPAPPGVYERKSPGKLL